jgi:aspartyl-tRNA(Asn)/glutamyl-tRNA(Gln) amidotransferase subunit A
MQGERMGALHGIPIGIKDIIDVAGLPTRAGSRLRAGEAFVAQNDALLVERLRREGAILLGKTVTTEFAYIDPPPTKNPWDPQLQHTPGGSSSGSAAAVAMGMCLGAIGTQTGGSLIRPASYCGVATIKPTFGTVPIDGVLPLSYHLDHPGPMARRVEDLVRILRVISDLPDPRASEPTAPPRLGLLEPFFMEEAEPSVRRTIEASLDRLRSGGARIVSVGLPASFASLHTMHRRIMAVDAAEVHQRQFAQNADVFGPKLRALLELGLATSAVDYAEALAAQRRFRSAVPAMLTDLDALVMPSTDTTAPARLDTTGDFKFQAPWSFAGVPAVTIPCGLADDRMPVGLQLAGRANDDFALLRIAQWCERLLEFNALPPLLAEPA